MPIGIIVDCIATALGGILGGLLSNKISSEKKEAFSQLNGFSAAFLGIVMIGRTENLGAVAISLLVGTIIGTYIDINRWAQKAVVGSLKNVIAKSGADFDFDCFSVVLLLCAFGGSGVVGAVMESATGDSSLLICRAILDFFTAVLFGARLGYVVAFIPIVQGVSELFFFLLAKVLSSYFTPIVCNDFYAVGGIVSLIGAFSIFKISNIKPVNAIISLVLIVPMSLLWQNLF